MDLHSIWDKIAGCCGEVAAIKRWPLVEMVTCSWMILV